MKAGLIENKYHLPRKSTLRDVENIYLAPECGFVNSEEYYSRCSAKQFISKIKTPTVIITSKDDPFVEVDNFKDVAISPYVHLHIENCGGHMGYWVKSKTPFGSRRWLDYALDHYLTIFNTAPQSSPDTSHKLCAASTSLKG